MNLALYKIVVDDIYALLSIEAAERSKNLRYIGYLDDWYNRDTTDLNFVRWLDIGYTALKTWETMLARFLADITRLSLESAVKTVRSSELLSDLNSWMLNFQNFRGQFSNTTIEDIGHRVDHLYLRLTNIAVGYTELTSKVDHG